MAGGLQQSSTQAQPYLSPTQQNLLVAALNSQANPRSQHHSTNNRIEEGGVHTDQLTMSANGNSTLFFSPESASMGQYDVDFTPEADFLDGDTSFDFEDADLGGDLIGGLPGLFPHKDGIAASGENNEKRKSPSEDDDPEEGDAKRQEVQEGEKSAKKPGRKPLTNEPTTKRKAQNRAAQRAFRERKEKHLKDLETKVAELEKAKEADRHENGLLKAQLERMSAELREYRKRLSLNSGINRSPTSATTDSQHRSNSGSFGNSFQFDFPKFGALPGSQLFGAQTSSPSTSPANNNYEGVSPATGRSPSTASTSQINGNAARTASVGGSFSPQTFSGNGLSADAASNLAGLDQSIPFFSTSDNMHGFASTLPQMSASGDLDNLFSPSILNTTNVEEYFSNAAANPGNQQPKSQTAETGGETTAGFDRVFQFNGGSNASDSTSPSASSASHWNANGINTSSCETSPEPSYESPLIKDKSPDVNIKTSRQSSTQPVFGTDEQAKVQPAFNYGDIDYSVPSLTDFDPVLFGDYRDSQEAIVGGGEFTGGFFDDALNSAPFDYSSPSNLFGILQSPQQSHASLNANNNTYAPKAAPPSKNLLAEIEKARDGGDDDYGLPTNKPKDSEAARKLISCNNIWTQLQSNPDFQTGKFDLDGLCAELRTKAKCSESGVMVDQAHVDQALRKLGKKDAAGAPYPGPKHLMFESDSWEQAMQKFNKNSQ